jgi:RimJ/RimL family protein N-acetyltransferase
MSQVYLSDGVVNLILQDESYAGIMSEWLNNHEVTTYLGRGHWPITIEEEKAYLKDRYKNQSELTLGIEIQATKELIGAIGLHRINYIHQNTELGIFIGDKNSWSKGFGSLAIKLLAGHAFARLNIRHIYLRVLGNNPRGQKCYEKCGFVEVGRFPKFIYKDGVWHDEIIMLNISP